MNKINLLQNVLLLQTRVNNLDTEQMKTSYARFKGKQRNISLYEKEGKCNAVVPKYPIYEAKSHKPTHNEKRK